MENANKTPSPDGSGGGLEQLINGRIVFIDTCSCLHGKFGVFINDLTPCLRAADSKLYIAYKCIEELIKKSEDAELAEKAKFALMVLTEMKSEGLLDVRGKATDSFADSTMLQNLLRYKEKYDLLLITQDRALATDALGLNKTLAVSSRGHTIKVRRIDPNGKLGALRLK